MGFQVKVNEVTLSEMHSSKSGYDVIMLSKRTGNENAVDGVFFRCGCQLFLKDKLWKMVYSSSRR